MARTSITDDQDWFTFEVETNAKHGDDEGPKAPVYVEVYDGNTGDTPVQAKMTKAQARKLGNALLKAAQ